VGNDELDEMLKMAPGPINFTIFLSMLGEKLKGQATPLYGHKGLHMSYMVHHM
jgi:hypothetical protein